MMPLCALPGKQVVCPDISSCILLGELCISLYQAPSVLSQYEPQHQVLHYRTHSLFGT